MLTRLSSPLLAARHAAETLARRPIRRHRGLKGIGRGSAALLNAVQSAALGLPESGVLVIIIAKNSTP
jgi:hypothetical protein